MDKNLFANLPEVQLKEKTVTLANILGIEGKETYITKWFGYLIDPNTFNDSSILQYILELYNEKLNFENKIEVNSFSNVEVNTEVPLSDYGIIDILVTMDECVIGIENKIYSGLGEKQLERYSKGLENYVPKEYDNENKEKNVLPTVKILLTSENNDAKPEAGFIKIVYEEIVGKLNSLVKDWDESARASLYLKDFIVYINEFLKEEEELFSEEWYSYLQQNYDDLKKIHEQGERALQNLKKSVEQRIGQMNTTETGEIWSIGKSRSGKGANSFWVQAHFSDWNTHSVHYEFIFPEATKGFLIPKELVLNLDVESGNTKKFLKKIGFGESKNEISKISLDSNDTDNSLNRLFKDLRSWHKKNFEKIDTELKNIESQVT